MLRKLLYGLMNWRAHARALFLGNSNGPADGSVSYESELSATVFRKDGRVESYGVVSRRVVTTVGVNFMASDFNGGTTDITTLNYHDSGTGTNAESVGDTDLQTPAGPTTRATGTQSNPTANQYRSTATITYSGSLAITEHGLFSQASRVGLGTLWDRSVFSVINVASGDSIQFQYTLTINAGG